MKAMEDLREMLCKELEEITMKGGLTAGDLDAVDKLTHSIKSIDTIMAMEESYSAGGYNAGGYNRSGYNNGGYSNGNYGGNYNRGYSARGRGGNARRDSRGRYARGMYRDGGKSHMVQMLQEMMEDAPDEKTRMAIESAISQMEQ